MLKSFLLKIHTNRLFKIIAIATVAVMVTGGFSFISNTKADAAINPVSINLIYYGTNSNTTNQIIIDANPEYIVNNSPAGPWRGNADINTFVSAGIKYFDYIDGGYEGTVAMAIPNDLQSNLNYIDAIAAAGAYGVFLDEVSPFPTAAGLGYLKQIADRAHSLGLKVVFNVGVDSWSDSLMEYCDYINSSEIWSNAPLTASQTKWASQTWFLTQGVNDAVTAARLTNAALGQGINALYACTSYMALPSWLDSYIALIEPATPATPVTTPEPVTTPDPVIESAPVTEPAPVVAPIIATIPTPESVTMPNPVVEPAPVTEPAPVVAPIITIPTPEPVTTSALTADTTPAPTTIVNTPVTPPAEQYTNGNFFSSLWQSLQGIWDSILTLAGI